MKTAVKKTDDFEMHKNFKLIRPCMDNKEKLKEILLKISRESILTESESYEIIKDAMIPIDLLESAADKIIYYANIGVMLPIIKVEMYSFMATQSVNNIYRIDGRHNN